MSTLRSLTDAEADAIFRAVKEDGYTLRDLTTWIKGPRLTSREALERRYTSHPDWAVTVKALLTQNAEPDPDLEPTAGGTLDDECEPEETEPSLGSFDRVMNQEHAWRGDYFADMELDDSDREDDDPDEPRQQPPVMSAVEG